MFDIIGGTIFFGGKPLKVDLYEYLRRYQALEKEIHECLSFWEFPEIKISIIFKKGILLETHIREEKHIVNNVCREVEKRLQQNEVSPSKCSISNLCEEIDLDKSESTIEDPPLEEHEEGRNHIVCGCHEAK